MVFAAVIGAAAVVGLVLAIVLRRDAQPETGPPCPGAAGRSRELRDCLADSLAFVSTPIATGSAVLLGDGHLVTNTQRSTPSPSSRSRSTVVSRSRTYQ